MSLIDMSTATAVRFVNSLIDDEDFYRQAEPFLIEAFNRSRCLRFTPSLRCLRFTPLVVFDSEEIVRRCLKRLRSELIYGEPTTLKFFLDWYRLFTASKLAS